MSTKTNILYICCVFLFCVSAFGQATRTWTGGGANHLASNSDNWDGPAPHDGDHIQLDGTSGKHVTWDAAAAQTVGSWTQTADYTGTVTFATTYPDFDTTFTNFTITGDCVINGGVITHTANPAADNERYRLCLMINGGLVVGPLASVNVTDQGFDTRRGPGGSTLSGVSSGMHGGRGGGTHSYSGISKCTYGSVTRPVNLGSGGSSGRGGGAIMIIVDNDSHVDGEITAKGSINGHYRGSGGSVWLVTGTLSGEGDINANGADITGANAPGGGGRVAVKLTDQGADFTVFEGVISAYGGERVGDDFPKRAAGPGTVYLELESDDEDQGELIIDNRGNRSFSTWFYEACATLSDIDVTSNAFRRIELRNNGLLTLGTNNILDITSAVPEGDGTGGIALEGGTLIVPPVFSYTNFSIYLRNVQVPGADYNSTGIGYPPVDANFNPGQALVIGANAGLYVDWPHTLTCNVTVASGGLLSHTSNEWNRSTHANQPANEQEFLPVEFHNRLILNIEGNLTIQPGGSMDVSAKGYVRNEGPGYVSTGGGSHGGRGGGLSSLPAPGPCYGSVTDPGSLGSHGGGGVVLLNVSGTLTNNGIISSSGATLAHYTAAGGSINITAGSIAGNGPIRANGGTATSTCPGGGGRVAVTVTNAGADFSGFSGAIEAFSGLVGVDARQSGAGTVYLQTSSQGPGEGVLLVDNNNRVNTRFTDINADVTDTVVGDVVIRNAGQLRITDQVITVGGTWSNASVFVAQTGSEVAFAGGSGNISRVYGNNEFWRLSCNDPGRIIRFEAGSLTSLAPGGRFRMVGSEADHLVLRSTSDNNAWQLDVDLAAEQNVMFVDVRDSDAGPGAEVTAINSHDSGGNSNWIFLTVISGETNEWTGAMDSAWSLRDNWSLDRSPEPSDFILIPDGCPHYPVLDDARTLYRIRITEGAFLSLNNHDLTITNNAVISGALIAEGTETVRFLGNADFTGGTFVPAASTVAFAGGDAQSFRFGAQAFHVVDIVNAGGPVTFEDGLNADVLRCAAPSGTRHLVFQHGSEYNLRDLVLHGSAGTTNIILRSSSSGQPWFLNVSGYRSVRGVDVADSNASGGMSIPAWNSRNSGGNVNWDFAPVVALWEGSQSSDFHDPANWSSAAVPDENTAVLVDTDAALEISGAAAVRELTVGGGSQQALVTVNALLTVSEHVSALTNGMLVWNQPGVIGSNLHIQGGGVLTHTENSTVAAGEQHKLDLTIHGDVHIHTGGSIDVMDKGLRTDQRWSADSTTANIGAAHGGRGQTGAFNVPCYGSIVAPTNIGSGGRGNYGAGAVILRVTGPIHNNGLICASSRTPTSGNAGSGGSVFLSAANLSGIGMIRANGGPCQEAVAGFR